MKTLRMFAVFALVAMSLFAVSADAQEISVFLGSEMATSKQVIPMEQFEIHVVVSNINDTLNAVEYSLNLPANVAIVGSTYWNSTSLVMWPVALRKTSRMALRCLVFLRLCSSR